MDTRVRTESRAALLQERLEALVALLAELEKLRERVGREENLQRELSEAALPVSQFGPRVGAPASHG
jgi:hypothetical protein